MPIAHLEITWYLIWRKENETRNSLVLSTHELELRVLHHSKFVKPLKNLGDCKKWTKSIYRLRNRAKWR
jgi:hypothetical protein